VKEYDLYLPLSYNDGRQVEAEKISRFKQVLLERFGGLTHFPQENEGLWKFGGITFRDKVVILRVLAEDGANAREFLAGFRKQVQRELAQAELLIVEREITTLE
jgi:hypothetical protein